MAKTYLQLPKGYLSYSQMSLWMSNREKYIELYFDGRKDSYTNRGQVYGKIVADALEANQETGDLLTDSAMLLLPKYDVRDQQFDVDVKTKDGWLKLVAKPDFLNSSTKDFIEVKTGVQPWTQSKANNHFQMIFYAVCIWQKYGVQLPDAILAWIATEYLEGMPTPTGLVKQFTVPFRPAQYLDTLMKMVRVAKEIEIAFASHVTKPWVTTF